MKSRKWILQKLILFYHDVRHEKKKVKRMRLLVNKELEQVKIKDLNNKGNAEMFTSSIRCNKGFATEQKVR